jgi:hypothetical protein
MNGELPMTGKPFALAIVLGYACAAFLTTRPAWGQEPTTEPVPPPVPIVIVNVASIERVLSDVHWTFETAGRPDMLDVVADFLSGIGDLKGVERGRPLGVMLFLPQVIPPQPVPVGYFPVSNLPDLLKMLEDGPLTARKLDAATERYELKGRRQTLHALLKDGYALVANDAEILDAKLPDIQDTVGPLATRYDVAATFRIQSVPALLREVFLGYLRMQSEAELQKRDDEPESAYLLRRANGISTLEFLDRLLREGENVTLGWDASQELKKGVFEINVEATPDSEFSKYLAELGGRPTTFGALYKEDEPMTLSVSWLMEKREKKAALEWIKALETQLARRLATETEGLDAASPPATGAAPPPRHPAVEALMDPLKATMEDGHFDLCIQFRATEPEKFVLIGALRLVGSEAFGSGLRQTLEALQGDENLEAVQLDAETHQGVAFHKLQGRNTPNVEQQIYGGKPTVHVGSGQRAVWFSVGAEGSFAELKRAMDTVLEANASGTANAPGGALRSAPFQAVFRVTPWMRIPPPDGDNGAARRELVGEALQKQNDAVKVEVRPTETGLRVRVALDEGFIKLLGLALARQYDRSRL